MDEDTIFAPMTAQGRSAISALRLSGPQTAMALQSLAGDRPAARRASLRTLRDAQGEVLDQAVVLWLPGPRSYTGEDTAELHLHGGRAVLEAVTEALLALGLRLAEPGEFSRRAFLNGRMDLLQAEAIGDLVAAETAGQRRQALRQMEGGLGRIYQAWAERLAQALAHQEALIDFPDEDLPPEVEAALVFELRGIEGEISAHLADGRRGERMREGLVFVVQGPPNAGKSTLVNTLAGRDAAIVSPIAGTTRDLLEIPLMLGEVPVTLIDTAGLRETHDPIEAEGVRRARARAAQADLVLTLVSAETADLAEEAEASWPTAAGTADRTEIIVATKCDLAPMPPRAALGISALTGQGMDSLIDRLVGYAREVTAQSGPPPLTRQRHRAHLSAARDHLAAAAAEQEPELRAELLRLALSEIGQISGKVSVEQLLDRIFADFCIGK